MYKPDITQADFTVDVDIECHGMRCEPVKILSEFVWCTSTMGTSLHIWARLDDDSKNWLAIAGLFQ